MMDYITILAVIVTVVVCFAAGVFVDKYASAALLTKMETAVKKAQTYLATYKDELVTTFGQSTYDQMCTLINAAVAALADNKVTTEETMGLIQDAYPLAKKALKFIKSKI